MFMQIAVIVDKFKGSLTSVRAGEIISTTILNANKNYKVMIFPAADGGDGTLEIFKYLGKGTSVFVELKDPLGRNVIVEYLLDEESNTAVIETAKIIGLSLLSDKERNPMYTSTYGLGLLIKDLINKGIKKFIIGLGGSATNDCGLGMAEALGYKFYNNTSLLTELNGHNLGLITKIDNSEFVYNKNINFIVLTDVNNPLIGETGASKVYAGQKGASDEEIIELEGNMIKFSEIAEKHFQKEIIHIPGSGAAGGLGAGLILFCNAELVSGSEYLFSQMNIEQIIKQSDLIITGEGRLDSQTMYGKTVFRIAEICKEYNKKLLAIVGDYEKQIDYSDYFDRIESIKKEEYTIEYAMNNAEVLLKNKLSQLIDEKYI